MANKVWVYIDHFKGKAVLMSWEAVGAARALAGQAPGAQSRVGTGVTALIFGSGVEGLAQQAFSYGVEEVKLCDDATLADFRVEPYAALLSKLADEEKPDVILAATTPRGRDVFATSAADLNTGVIADATVLEANDGVVRVTRPVYAGKLLSTVVCKDKRPQMITLRARAFTAPEPDGSKSGAVQVQRVAPVLAEDAISTKVVDYAIEENRVSLDSAKIIVSGGRGVGGPEGFEPVRELAKAFGGALGASRAAVDAGWIPYAHQVGQTGKVVSPDLYVACGISGAIQHLVGMRTAKVIVAINKDAEASIFRNVHYGVVGDLFKIVPAVTAEVKKRRGL
jgi:electron transfer flavoprotein alpha subunit